MKNLSSIDLLLTPLPAMIFLQDNILLERDLKFDDIKPRLLGMCILVHPSSFHCLMAIARSLGNLSGLDVGLFASQLVS